VSILNEPSDGTLSVLLALRGALRAYGPMPKERLLALCAPPPLGDDERPKFTLERWVQLGAFSEVEGEVQLAGALATEATDRLDALRAALLEIVLRPANNPPHRSQGRSRGVAPSGATDFTRAACWCLLQDPYTFQPDFEQYVNPSQKDQGIDAVQNDVRWNGFARWSTFLGVAVKMPRGLLLNPAFAIGQAVREFVPAGQQVGLKEFLERMAARFPVLPGGAMSNAVASEVKSPWRTFAPHEVAPTVALALLQLHEGGAIALSKQSDADVRRFLGRGGLEFDELTHLERKA
jgi:hypothetical protein